MIIRASMANIFQEILSFREFEIEISVYVPGSRGLREKLCPSEGPENA